MPRDMAKDATYIYRVKIEQAGYDGGIWVHYNGPYASAVPAMAQKVRIDRQQERWPSQLPKTVTVERTQCIWTAVE